YVHPHPHRRGARVRAAGRRAGAVANRGGAARRRGGAVGAWPEGERAAGGERESRAGHELGSLVLGGWAGGDAAGARGGASVRGSRRRARPRRAGGVRRGVDRGGDEATVSPAVGGVTWSAHAGPAA